MKKILPILVIVGALIGGIALGGAAHIATGGGTKKSGPATHEDSEHPKETGHGKKSGHGEDTAKSAYLKFGRQFVAPVIKNGVPIGMMILDVNIELDPAIGQSAYSEEPRLRDAVMEVLLRQGAKGRLNDLFVDPAVLDETKEEILTASRKILGDGARSVLIMDIGYQRM